MAQDQNYQEWLENARKEWDADEMLDKLSKVSDIEPKKLKLLLGHLRNVFECGEMLEFLIDTYELPPIDAVGMYMGENV